MTTRKGGRVSMAELMTPKNALEKVERPDAPYELDDDEALEWKAQVEAMPAGHFTRSTYPLLVALCQHVVTARRLKQIEREIRKPGKGKSFDARAYGAIIKELRCETGEINRCLRAMRLTQQSTTRPETLSRKLSNQTIDRPSVWGDVEEDDEK